ncbi:MAG: ribonuclease H-like domain-containing protein [Planctomycetes bacterium]|nr:ribonuclease H-like domain-containing protein [Planctomycetota bacterium]
MGTLSRRLDDLKARRLTGGSAPPRRRPATRRDLAAVVGGKQRRCGALAYWDVETTFTDVCPDHTIRRSMLRHPLECAATAKQTVTIDPARTLVIDIETGGLTSGLPVFLIGVVPLDTWPCRIHQWLARDYPEEQAIVAQMARWALGRNTWVTFNGKTFDVPFLRDRARLHRVALTQPEIHVDVLHVARRRWRSELPDCRLGTLERHVLERERVGDVPGCDVPDLFHHFIRTGNAAPLAPVLEHNQIDLVSTAELLVRLAQPAPAGTRPHCRRI